MRTFVLILLPAAALVLWAIVEERKLRAMDSGAGKAMQQVGVRLAACLDAVAALLDLTWDYTARQAPQAETVRSGQGVIVSASQAADVTAQEALALDALRDVAPSRQASSESLVLPSARTFSGPNSCRIAATHRHRGIHVLRPTSRISSAKRP